MTRLLILKWIVAVVCVCCSGCSSRWDDKPGKDYLDLALAGMAGSDEVTFDGATALLRGSDGTPYETFYYGGKMEGHSKITMYTLLPDVSSSKAQGSGDFEPLGQLEKIEGHWQSLSQSSLQEDNPLPRLNPLQQLEELEGLDKKVTEEIGAGRGTRILRIELTPEEAHNQLVAELNQELSALRSVHQTSNKGQTAANSQLDKALLTFWKKQDLELKLKLEQAQVETVYHLDVDSRRNLPRRLAWTRTVNFLGDPEKTLSEMYVSQIDFYGYR